MNMIFSQWLRDLTADQIYRYKIGRSNFANLHMVTSKEVFEPSHHLQNRQKEHYKHHPIKV